MKGQAFVGMPSEDLALQALQDTNGYLLQGKPLVVVSSLLLLYTLLYTMLCVVDINKSYLVLL